MEGPCYNISRLLLDSKYILEYKISTGFSSKVYKVKDSFSDKEYAAKIFKKNKVFLMKKEIKFNEIISKFQHPFFVKYISSSIGLLEKDGSKKDKCHYIIFELASKGSLYNYIKCNNMGFNETTCKFIFYKILQAIQILNKNGISYKDLEIKNILLDDNFNIKISNFGHSSFIKGDNGQNSRNEKYGNIPYITTDAKRLKYKEEKSELFNLGVLLIILRTGKMPFLKETSKNNIKFNENIYKLIENKKFDQFWSLLEINESSKGLSQEFKKLFIKMSGDPFERLSIEEIYNDDWMKEITNLNEKEFKIYEQQMINELKEREIIINNMIKKDDDLLTF